MPADRRSEVRRHRHAARCVRCCIEFGVPWRSRPWPHSPRRIDKVGVSQSGCASFRDGAQRREGRNAECFTVYVNGGVAADVDLAKEVNAIVNFSVAPFGQVDWTSLSAPRKPTVMVALFAVVLSVPSPAGYEVRKLAVESCRPLCCRSTSRDLRNTRRRPRRACCHWCRALPIQGEARINDISHQCSMRDVDTLR